VFFPINLLQPALFSPALTSAHDTRHTKKKDSPVPIGWSQTISAPHMHAAALDMLEGQLVPGARALDVGSGSGYLAAAMALLVGPGGCVLGVDKHAPLVERSRAAVAAALPPAAAALVTLINANALGGDDDALGGPFDAIHVGAAADHLPASLVAALAPGGRLIIPVGPDVTGPGAAVGGGQVLKVVDKSPDGRSVSEEDVMGVRFVPLTAPGVDREGGL
jgi:protein-L-isoaspartate(D-aspartate) O-methyltransferase